MTGGVRNPNRERLMNPNMSVIATTGWEMIRCFAQSFLIDVFQPAATRAARPPLKNAKR